MNEQEPHVLRRHGSIRPSEAPAKRGATIWIGDDGWLHCRFPYDADTVAAIKDIEREDRRWDPDTRTWAVDPDLHPELVELLSRRFEVTDGTVAEKARREALEGHARRRHAIREQFESTNVAIFDKYTVIVGGCIIGGGRDR
ncbi:MAG: hypothetical protein KIT31_42385 [Deltaproteobacteria bacterium]|nr:hypothetical protein [Deltaproteobacteria bacterium]